MRPGYSLTENVLAMVIGKSGTCPVEENGHSNMLTSKMTSLQDDAGESIGPIDFTRETYQQLVKLFTAPSDWVLNISIASGECTVQMSILKVQPLLG